MIKHYAPDVPTFIALGSAPSGEPLYLPASPVTASSAVVIDFGARLVEFKAACGANYIELSPTGNAIDACKNVFKALRLTEDRKREDPFISLVLLPDLRGPATEDQLTRALWERLHRAASGTFIEKQSVVLSDSAR